MPTLEVDVLVVGAGPGGASASLALARSGIKVLAISKYPGPAPSPRALLVNQRTMEVFGDLGIERRISEAGTSATKLNNVVLATSLAGLEIARYPGYGTSPERLSEYAAASPYGLFVCPQHLMEPIIVQAARESGADVRFDNELVDIRERSDLVLADVVDRQSGESHTVRARYVIGADGGRSFVASRLGFSFAGEVGLRTMATTWFEADLNKYTAYRPSMVYWFAQPGPAPWFGTASLACVRPFTDWYMIQPWEGRNGQPSHDEVIETARTVIGDAEIPIRIKESAIWQVNNVVATNYRKGRAFLIGDAAHRHPPTGGLGANTAIQDAFGLAWKLAMAVRGEGGDRLLDTHSSERQPVGAHVVDRANKGLANFAPLVAALGFRPGNSETEDWAKLHELYSDAPGAAERRKELGDAVQLQNYRSNALGVQLGQRYESGAFVPEPATPIDEYDSELHYHPSTRPGVTVPHAWIEYDQQKRSVHDITGHGRFTLIVGIGGEPWRVAAGQVAQELGIEIRVCRVGMRCEYDDVTRAWERVREVGDRGAVLVRPDRFVAWRSHDLPQSPANVLRGVFVHSGIEGQTPCDTQNSSPRGRLATPDLGVC